MNALDLLIEDCWIEVLKRVRNPEDLKSCCETCLTFEKILTWKKNAFLFELILPKIIGYLVLDYLQEIMKGAEEKTSLKVLLDCRLVCKDWCKAIDKLENTDSFRHPAVSKYCFDSGETTEQFLQMFGAHDGNPIIGRNVGIEHRGSVLMAQPQVNVQNEGVPHEEVFHITKIRELLDRFGKGIWRVYLTEENGEISYSHHLAFCKNIQSILSRVPNLHTLLITSFDRLRLNDTLEEMDQENMEELSAYIAANPLPPLPSLPHLESISVADLNLGMTKLIFEKYSSQLKHLVINHPSHFLEEFPRFSCLKELYLAPLDTSDSLQGLQQLHSPLEKLGLSVGFNRNELTVWPIDELFRNIQHLPIRELDIINFSDVVCMGESAPISPELRVLNESIYSVKISFVVSGTISLNLLAYCPNLEEFSVLLDPSLLSPHPNGVPELYDVTDFIKKDQDLYQSSVWEAIPSLKKLTDASGGQTHYHRKIYEEKRENMKDPACP